MGKKQKWELKRDLRELEKQVLQLMQDNPELKNPSKLILEYYKQFHQIHNLENLVNRSLLHKNHPMKVPAIEYVTRSRRTLIQYSFIELTEEEQQAFREFEEASAEHYAAKKRFEYQPEEKGLFD